jgi:hypothetical protein
MLTASFVSRVCRSTNSLHCMPRLPVNARGLRSGHRHVGQARDEVTTILILYVCLLITNGAVVLHVSADEGRGRGAGGNG